MSDQLNVNSEELRRLGGSFSTHAYDLGSYLADFRRQTGIEPAREALAALDPALCEQLAEAVELAGWATARLQDRLDEISSGMKAVARNTDEIHEGFADQIRDLT